jgi:hypothetical protein
MTNKNMISADKARETRSSAGKRENAIASEAAPGNLRCHMQAFKAIGGVPFEILATSEGDAAARAYAGPVSDPRRRRPSRCSIATRATIRARGRADTGPTP